ncbi:hypothetical protein LTR37_001408 [Vermiconidia calcicola]|uniref:Uncharacterized protein n=1 Tax=Vermiconidia calcicola TaxID=1690605 RepID=A0ACC3NWZ7_9PEZI|nr:hypothetical protein LTR37_001408 [Vermiconidia calcicola]
MQSSSSDSIGQPTGILSLPREIRDKIYYLAIVPDRETTMEAFETTNFDGLPQAWALYRSSKWCSTKAPYWAFTSLSRVCQQLHDEADEVFFQHVSVLIEMPFNNFNNSTRDLTIFKSLIVPPKHLRRITAITIESDDQYIRLIVQGLHYANIRHIVDIKKPRIVDGGCVKWQIEELWEEEPYSEIMQDHLDWLAERNSHTTSRILAAGMDWHVALLRMLDHICGRWAQNFDVKLICGTRDYSDVLIDFTEILH